MGAGGALCSKRVATAGAAPARGSAGQRVPGTRWPGQERDGWDWEVSTPGGGHCKETRGGERCAGGLDGAGVAREAQGSANPPAAAARLSAPAEGRSGLSQSSAALQTLLFERSDPQRTG